MLPELEAGRHTVIALCTRPGFEYAEGRPPFGRGPARLNGLLVLRTDKTAFHGRVTRVVEYQKTQLVFEFDGEEDGQRNAPMKLWVGMEYRDVRMTKRQSCRFAVLRGLGLLKRDCLSTAVPGGPRNLLPGMEHTHRSFGSVSDEGMQARSHAPPVCRRQR